MLIKGNRAASEIDGFPGGRTGDVFRDLVNDSFAFPNALNQSVVA